MDTKLWALIMRLTFVSHLFPDPATMDENNVLMVNNTIEGFVELLTDHGFSEDDAHIILSASMASVLHPN